MTPTEEVIVTQAQEANHNAERAYWWMKGITHDPDCPCREKGGENE